MEINLAKPQKTLVICSIFILGVVIALTQSCNCLITVTAVLIALLLFFNLKKFVSIRFAIVCLAVYAFSIMYTNCRIPEPDKLYSLAPEKLYLKGQVVSNPQENLPIKTKFQFKVNYLKENDQWVPVKAKTMVYIYDKKRQFENIHIGDALEIYGSVNHPFVATNPGQFDYGKYLNRKGIFSMTYVRHNNYKIIGDSGINIWYFLDKLNFVRNKILNVHRKHLVSPKLELLGGMVFGDYAVPAPKDIEDNFKKSGLLHLLAASGLNVGIIFGIWFFIASKANLPYRPKILTGMALVGIYSLLTGLPPSVTRAALMMEAVLLGKLLDRKTESSVLLVIVCTLMLIFDPLMITNVGFQLSFIVTLGLLLFVPLLVGKAKPLPEWLSGAFLVPFVAQVFVAPVLAFHFNTFSMYSIFANMAVIPFVGVISFSGFSGSIFALIPVIGEKICFITDKIAEPFLSLLLIISKFTADLPNALLYLPKPHIEEIIIFYIMLFAFYKCLKIEFNNKKLNKIALILLLTLLTLVFRGNLNFNNNLEFVFFDVGEGDSALVKTPNNKYFLVDTGPYSKYSPAKMAIIPYLRDKGIQKLDAILLTHPDMDHTGGTVHLLQNINVKKVFHNGVTNNSITSRVIRKYFSKNSITPEILKDGDALNFDKDVKIQVIRPENVLNDNDNEDSLILYITYKDFTALLMADCEAGALPNLKEVVKEPVDLLKVGHHGSHNSVNKEFMNYVQPRFSIVSVGRKGYHFNHPHPEVMAHLNNSDSKVFRTDKNFAVKITTDGRKIKYESFKKW